MFERISCGWTQLTERKEPTIYISALGFGLRAEFNMSVNEAEKLKNELVAVLEKLKGEKNGN